MTLDAFSSFLKEFIIAQDAVAVPGLGEFISRMQPATISDNGFTINPPYRRLEFVSPVPADTVGVQFFDALYSAKALTPREQAGLEVNSVVEEIKSVLDKESVVELAGLGRLRTLADGGVFFIMDRDAQIFPDGFGLESVSLKNRPAAPFQPVDIPQPVLASHAAAVSQSAPAAQPIPSASAQPTATVQSGTAVSQSAPAAQPIPSASAQPTATVQSGTAVSQSAPAAQPIPSASAQPTATVQSGTAVSQSAPAAQSESAGHPDSGVPAPQPQPKKRLPVGWKIVLWLAVLAALAVAAFIVLMNFFPDVLDRLLYSPQELEIIRNSGI